LQTKEKKATDTPGHTGDGSGELQTPSLSVTKSHLSKSYSINKGVRRVKKVALTKPTLTKCHLVGVVGLFSTWLGWRGKGVRHCHRPG